MREFHQGHVQHHRPGRQVHLDSERCGSSCAETEPYRGTRIAKTTTQQGQQNPFGPDTSVADASSPRAVQELQFGSPNQNP